MDCFSAGNPSEGFPVPGYRVRFAPRGALRAGRRRRANTGVRRVPRATPGWLNFDETADKLFH